MKRFATALAAAAALAAPAAATASHGSSRAEVFKLEDKVGSLSSRIAHQGIRKRLANHDFRVREYRGRCRRLSRTRRRCTYKFKDPLQQALGEGSYCGSRRGTTVRLIRKGTAIAVGPTPTRDC